MATCVGARGAAGRAQPLAAPSYTAAARGVRGGTAAPVRGAGVVGRGRIAVRPRGRRLAVGGAAPRAALATQSQTTAAAAARSKEVFVSDVRPRARAMILTHDCTQTLPCHRTPSRLPQA